MAVSDRIADTVSPILPNPVPQVLSGSCAIQILGHIVLSPHYPSIINVAEEKCQKQCSGREKIKLERQTNTYAPFRALSRKAWAFLPMTSVK